MVISRQLPPETFTPGFSALRVEFLPVRRQAWYSPTRTFLDRRVMLIEPLTWISPVGQVYEIEAGFESDGPSYPMLVAPMMPSRIRTMESGIFHDWVCRRTGDLPLADSLFRSALKTQLIQEPYAYMGYAGLRLASRWREVPNAAA